MLLFICTRGQVLHALGILHDHGLGFLCCHYSKGSLHVPDCFDIVDILLSTRRNNNPKTATDKCKVLFKKKTTSVVRQKIFSPFLPVLVPDWWICVYHN